ncbi:hypothetical protein PYW08_008979 [Mythimna loreyi]|uniref:Uncharacterized protein n=1 Tax=Mythimna loreyi TaxID=667449 RepID=A0ACC2Q7F8_9NEOP|nr:hypothetical protein PYW08_008979 [Mythimna loreyi]
MLSVIIITIVATSSAFTTHRYDAYDNFGNYRPSAPLSDHFSGNDNSNRRNPTQIYEYAKRYDGVVISDVYQRQQPSDGANRRVDMPNSYQNPYQWNRQVPWNRVAVTEPTKFFNRFDVSNEDRKQYNPDTRNGRPVVQQDTEDLNLRKQANEINETQGNLPQISTQSDDVNSTLVSTESPTTWDQGLSEDNANITARSINSLNNLNSLNVAEQNHDKINRPTESNGRSTNDNNGNTSASNSNVYSTKTTQDNEVTPRPQEPRTKPYEDDRWVWSNGEDQAVETTTLTDLADRAAFSGDGCPAGKAKLGRLCVEKD